MRKSGRGYARVSEAVFREHLANFDTWDGIDWDNPIAGKTWDPVEIGLYTPTPFHVKHLLPEPEKPPKPKYPPAYSWGPALELLSGRDVWYIQGAGASPLRMDLSPLDGEVVYGVNWLLKWYCPTFLQIIDRNPLHSQITKSEKWRDGGQKKKTLLVSSRWAVDRYVPYEGRDTLCFEIHHPGGRSKQGEFHFAEKPEPPMENKMTWYPNSLGYSLNVAYWFRPKRVVLLGFDFGGPHFFGDGRTQGCQGHYGIRKMGGPRGKLIPHLVTVRDFLLQRGQDVVQVGPSKLDVFPRVDTLEEVKDAGERKFLTADWVAEWKDRSDQVSREQGPDKVGLRDSLQGAAPDVG